MTPGMNDHPQQSAELNPAVVPATRRYLPPGHVRDNDPADDYAHVRIPVVDWDIEDGFLDSEEVVV
ncbi:hypothetical protein [Paenarthrobacter sp. PH39-S1]|uniref:hypothetical protein n=1 Tax=Paenarthrobacter sp. PH39-S1 TaxID=3046204 RepID=UPI0024B97D30|nr:hypothetical protein [Paenarthrobacter sp. PH39-S1]MDJ0357038.1 hypothetical protein [Paenarthrobacter sp. PH39-S1]